MLGLTLLLTKTSAALGGAATLLIRLCTLWFGLGLGVIVLCIYRLQEQANPLIDHVEEQHDNLNGPGPLDADVPGLHLQTASASASTGDKAV
jgi:hypothetical protein